MPTLSKGFPPYLTLLFVGQLSVGGDSNAQDVSACWESVVARPATECDPTPFCLIFEDEFNANSLDLSKWKAIEGVPRDKSAAPMWYTPENIVVEDGVLKLKLEHNPQSHTYSANWTAENGHTWETRLFFYESAEINSYYNYGEGKYVAKIRTPPGNGGFFPAFWMYGEQPCEVTELDVFEYWGNDWDNWHTNVHRKLGCYYTNCAVDFNTGLSSTYWKEYALQWDRHSILWFRDDVGIVRLFLRWKTILDQIV